MEPKTTALFAVCVGFLLTLAAGLFWIKPPHTQVTPSAPLSEAGLNIQPTRKERRALSKAFALKAKGRPEAACRAFTALLATRPSPSVRQACWRQVAALSGGGHHQTDRKRTPLMVHLSLQEAVGRRCGRAR